MAIEIYGSLILTVAPSKDQKKPVLRTQDAEKASKKQTTRPDPSRIYFLPACCADSCPWFFSCPVTAIHVQNHHISSHHVRYQCIGSNIVRNHPKSPPSSTWKQNVPKNPRIPQNHWPKTSKLDQLLSPNVVDKLVVNAASYMGWV